MLNLKSEYVFRFFFICTNFIKYEGEFVFLIIENEKFFYKNVTIPIYYYSFMLFLNKIKEDCRLFCIITEIVNKYM